MYGAIIGDVVGSVYEFNNIKTKDFPLITEASDFTDDSIMTVAVAKALIKARREEKSFKMVLADTMREYGNRYPCPKGGYGGRFSQWLANENYGPYYSFGNGSAMRVSPCGLIAVELDEALQLAKASAEVTHNHPEGIKGAQAVAAAVFMAKSEETKDSIKNYIENNFYKLNFKIDDIRESYKFNETCQGTVPQAIVAFLESDSFEDAIRNAVSLGGDSDTLTAITGSIAWAFYRIGFFDKIVGEEKVTLWGKDGFKVYLRDTMAEIREKVEEKLPKDMAEFIEWFAAFCLSRAGAYERIGIIKGIPL